MYTQVKMAATHAHNAHTHLKMAPTHAHNAHAHMKVVSILAQTRTLEDGSHTCNTFKNVLKDGAQRLVLAPKAQPDKAVPL